MGPTSKRFLRTLAVSLLFLPAWWTILTWLMAGVGR